VPIRIVIPQESMLSHPNIRGGPLAGNAGDLRR